MAEKNLELDRLVFFSDAVVAIAITLLALDLKIDKTTTNHLRFSDLLSAADNFAAFVLSFFIIAAFWKVHHEFFYYIKKIDNKLLWNNVAWLLFIVILPFSSSLVSEYFFDKASNFVYSANVFLITIFQNNIWDHASAKFAHIKEGTGSDIVRSYRIACNVAMLNAILAMILSFIYPPAAFITLLVRLPMILFTNRFFTRTKTRK